MAAVVAIRSQLVGVSAVTLYTASATSAECEVLDIFNRLTTDVTIDLWHEKADGTTLTYIVKTFALPAGNAFAYRGSIVFDENNSKLRILSNTAASLDVLGRVTTF